MPGCKPGDLARHLGGRNQGNLVVVLHKDLPVIACEGGLWWECKSLQPVMLRKLRRYTKGPVVEVEGWAEQPPGTVYTVNDQNLQPIRPGDLEGEHPGDKLVEPSQESQCSDSSVSA